VCPQLRIIVRRVRIREPRTRQYRRTGDTALQALFPQCEPLQLIQAIPLRSTVYKRVLEQSLPGGITPHGAFMGRACFLELPGVAAFVQLEVREVISFVEVFEDRGEDLGDLFGEGDAFRAAFDELAAGYRGEEWGRGEDVGVSGEEASGGADDEGYYGRGKVAV